MSIDNLQSQLGDCAKDIKLNLGAVLTPEGAPDLSHNQIMGIALAAAYATRQKVVVDAVLDEGRAVLSAAEISAAKSAANIMAMNNVYYRFAHLVSDKEYGKMPARLRMNVIGNPGIAKTDFELYALGISAVNGCGMCMDAHVNEAVKAGISKVGVQSVIRIASVINAAAQAVFTATLEPAAAEAAAA
jgi:alkyl hydroperoxide reductase subunit D